MLAGRHARRPPRIGISLARNQLLPLGEKVSILVLVWTTNQLDGDNAGVGTPRIGLHLLANVIGIRITSDVDHLIRDFLMLKAARTAIPATDEVMNLHAMLYKLQISDSRRPWTFRPPNDTVVKTEIVDRILFRQRRQLE